MLGNERLGQREIEISYVHGLSSARRMWRCACT
jgi:hypothetical protein